MKLMRPGFGPTLLREAAAQDKPSRTLIRDTHERVKRAAREQRLFAV